MRSLGGRGGGAWDRLRLDIVEDGIFKIKEGQQCTRRRRRRRRRCGERRERRLGLEVVI